MFAGRIQHWHIMNKFFLLTTGIILLSACSTDKGYELSGTIKGLSDGTIYLQHRIDKAYISLDSVKSTDGTFTFTGKVDIPDVYYISIPGQQSRSMLFLENSRINLSVHVDSLYYPNVSGSAVHDEYTALEGQIDAIYERMDALWAEYQQASASGDTAIANELNAQMESVYETIGETQMAYLNENPSSYIAPYVVQSLHYGKEAEEIEDLLAKLDPILESTTLVGSMKKRVEVLKNVAVGKMAPDFTQNDPEGNPVSLASLRGNYLLIDFWASWCGPCRRENPNIVAAYSKYHEKGFDILGVSLDNSKERWLQAIEADRLTWNHVSDLKYWSNEAAAIYGISSIPSSLLLDREGKIIAKNLKGKDLHSELEKLLTP